MSPIPELLPGCRKSSACHMCKSPELRSVLDLGFQPHSDDFLSPDRLDEFECTYPLRLVSCGNCGLLQIDYFVDPEILYGVNYVYQSSVTKTGREHYRTMATEVAKRFTDPAGRLAVDIGSNVGVLLQGFKEEGFAVLGVDPAQKVASIAQGNGIDTVVNFFDLSVAEQIQAEKGPASVISGTNVFAHLHDLAGSIRGMDRLLSADGVIVIEAPYALDLIEKIEYDTIYHQHIGYLSVAPMQRYFASSGFELFDVEYQDIHGGTLRYSVQRAGGPRPISPAVGEYVQKEKDFGLYDMARLETFAQEVRSQRQELLDLLLSIKREGKRIVGISAPAKGNTLLNYCHIDSQFLEYVTERNELKVGKYTPGTHLLIKEDSVLDTDTPEYALILAWNFADEIMRNLAGYHDRGGKFIIPIPRPVVV